MTVRSFSLMTLLACFMVTGAHAAEPQVTEGFINAPAAEVWRLFTTSEGFLATGAATVDIDLRVGGVVTVRAWPFTGLVAKVDVDLRVGGSIRSHYDPKGTLGDAETIVNEILAYEPERMLAIRIKQTPASFPYRNAAKSAWTIVYFTPSGDSMTHVRMVGLGYTDDPESQAMRSFFAAGNRATLDHLAKPYWPKCAHCAAEEGDKR